jgi:hypothetical protein
VAILAMIGAFVFRLSSVWLILGGAVVAYVLYLI